MPDKIGLRRFVDEAEYSRSKPWRDNGSDLLILENEPFHATNRIWDD